MHDRRARTVGGRFPKRLPFFLPGRALSRKSLRNDPQGTGRTHATVSSIAWLGRLRTLMCVISAITPFMCEVAGSPVLKSSARAQTAVHSEAVDRFAEFIKEASGRFTLPARSIHAVMQVESSGDEMRSRLAVPWG
jgi:hypothetical protein